MSTQSDIVTAQHEPNQATLKGYIVGFGGSIVLTLAAYLLVSDHSLSQHSKIIDLAVLALAQFFLQLIYFLHLGREFKPRWKLVVFGFMVTIVLILVGGSLWIMTNLNNRMSPAQMTTYMNDQDGL